MPNLLPGLLVFSIWTVSAIVGALPLTLTEGQSYFLRLVSYAGLPLLFAFSFVSTAGLLSKMAQGKIIKGKFPREPFHRIYFWRRVYGACWTTVYYCKPLYAAVVAIPIFKKMVFRLFGYRGPCHFAIYPDTWIRDLPLLHLGNGSYLSNRCTLGTNMCLTDGTILVDHVFIGDRTMIGHLCMVAPGARLEEDVEIGVGSTVGIKSQFKKSSKVGVCCFVNHGAIFRENAVLGSHSYVGLRAEIGRDVKIPAGANIPAGAVIETQADVAKHFSSENLAIRTHVQDISDLLTRGLENIS